MLRFVLGPGGLREAYGRPTEAPGRPTGQPRGTFRGPGARAKKHKNPCFWQGPIERAPGGFLVGFGRGPEGPNNV